MMAGSGLSRLTMVVARLACSSRPWKMYDGAVDRRRAGGAARRRHPAVAGLRFAGLAGGVGGEVLRAQVQQRQDGLFDGVGDAAPRGLADGSRPGGGSWRWSSRGPCRRSWRPASSSNSSRMTSTPMRQGPQRPHDSSCMSLMYLKARSTAQTSPLTHDAAPRHDGLDLGHVGLFKAGEHLLGRGTSVRIGESHDGLGGGRCRRLGHCLETSYK